MIGYELLSHQLSGQINLMQDDLDATTIAVLDQLFALGGFDPGTDARIGIKRYCNLAEDPHREKKDREIKEWVREHFCDPMPSTLGSRPYIHTPSTKEEDEEGKE